MDSHDNSWEVLTGLPLESTQRSSTNVLVDIHAGPAPDVAPNGTEVRIASSAVTTGDHLRREETGIGNQNAATESMSWDWAFKQLRKTLKAVKGAATYQVVEFVKKQ